MAKWTLGQMGKTNPIQSQFKANTKPIQTQNKPKQTQRSSAVSVAGQRQNNVFARAKILTTTNRNANFKKRMVFKLFIERTLFGR